MIKLITITGFLGSGKTTLLDAMLGALKKEKVGVIVNDFGLINVDAKLIDREGIEMAELSNGSVFCACIKDKFVESLVELSKKDIDYLIIEASGLADPSNMPGILKGLDGVLERKYSFEHSICVVDCTSYLKLAETLVAVDRQLEFSDIIVMNKCDLCDAATLDIIEKSILEKKCDEYALYRTEYCKLDYDEIIRKTSSLNRESKDTINSRENRPLSIVLKQKEMLTQKELTDFLDAIKDSCFRIKGFIRTDEGLMRISCVGDQSEIRTWKLEEESALVIISSVGIELISRVVSASENCAEGKIYY